MYLSAFALKLLTNLSVSCSLASNRVKAKSAITLELNHIDMQNRHMALCHSERKPMAQRRIQNLAA